MGNFRGLADLQTPADLVRKLEFDLGRIEKTDTTQNRLYAAFDFFVTAEHILDWKYPDSMPGGNNKRSDLRREQILLELTSHLANGVKHFEATAKQHDSVDEVKNESYIEDGYVEPGWIENPIVVHLTGAAKSVFGDDSIEVSALARRVYEYWSINISK